MNFAPDFELNCIIKGTVVEVIKETDTAPAGIQFLTKTDRKFGFVDLKVVGSKSKDLEQFLSKKVIVEQVKVFQVDYSKFYRVDDISLISILDKKV